MPPENSHLGQKIIAKAWERKLHGEEERLWGAEIQKGTCVPKAESLLRRPKKTPNDVHIRWAANLASTAREG